MNGIEQYTNEGEKHVRGIKRQRGKGYFEGGERGRIKGEAIYFSINE